MALAISWPSSQPGTLVLPSTPAPMQANSQRPLGPTCFCHLPLHWSGYPRRSPPPKSVIKCLDKPTRIAGYVVAHAEGLRVEGHSYRPNLLADLPGTGGQAVASRKRLSAHLHIVALCMLLANQ